MENLRDILTCAKEAFKKEITWWFDWGHLWDER